MPIEAENAVAIKLPTFWMAQPRVWFQQIEAQFALKNVTTEETKFYYVVSALDQQTASRLIDFLERPPQDNRYTAIKQRLLDTFDLSRQERSARLLNMPPLGDKKPTQLMDEMLALLGDHRSCFLFEHLFMQQMPEDIRLILAREDFDEPRALAKRADTLWLARCSSNTDYTISKVKRAKQATQSLSPGRSADANLICFYHRRFGLKALNCCPPCAFQQGNAKPGCL